MTRTTDRITEMMKIMLLTVGNILETLPIQHATRKSTNNGATINFVLALDISMVVELSNKIIINSYLMVNCQADTDNNKNQNRDCDCFDLG